MATVVGDAYLRRNFQGCVSSHHPADRSGLGHGPEVRSEAGYIGKTQHLPFLLIKSRCYLNNKAKNF